MEKTSREIWQEAIMENQIDELPSLYSSDAPPHMQIRILWNKVNELIKIINKINSK